MSKIQTIKEAHQNFMLDVVGDLAKRDPSGTNKYLPFMVNASADYFEKYIQSLEYIDDIFRDVIKLVTDFDKYCKLNLIENKDIYSYGSAVEVDAVVSEAKSKNTNREIKEQQTIVLYEDKDKILVKCLSKASSNLYGRNTEWCTSATKTTNRFDEYAGNGVLMYFIYKNPPDGMPAKWRKLALNRQDPEKERRVWDSEDKEVVVFDAMRLFTYIGQEVMGIITKEYDLCIPNTAMKKNADGMIILDETLLDKPFYKKQKEEIKKYILGLKDNRLSSNSFASFVPPLDSNQTVEDEDDVDVDPCEKIKDSVVAVKKSFSETEN
jgi:hypothetical protein